ncbi:hypothetical protein QR98_0102290 [Sarcoptes scabiei]|uniref:Uncharacterized protein n=1 Tax=Sarcoptes scabiei TaxID=52283 RepID=A0A132AKZ6_SARSC|nr:hypothetical protein QR98_0102290 [Sarcoptes scabiei]
MTIRMILIATSKLKSNVKGLNDSENIIRIPVITSHQSEENGIEIDQTEGKKKPSTTQSFSNVSRAESGATMTGESVDPPTSIVPFQSSEARLICLSPSSSSASTSSSSPPSPEARRLNDYENSSNESFKINETNFCDLIIDWNDSIAIPEYSLIESFQS